METDTMGKVLVKVRIENLNDLYEVTQGRLTPEGVRAVEVDAALVDTGATYLSMPASMAQQLGLQKYRSRQARTAAGFANFDIYGMAQLTCQGREARVEVAALPEGGPVLIGQIPLEILDFVVDPQGQRLLGNPDHGGEQMLEFWSVFPGQG